MNQNQERELFTCLEAISSSPDSHAPPAWLVHEDVTPLGPEPTHGRTLGALWQGEPLPHPSGRAVPSRWHAAAWLGEGEVRLATATSLDAALREVEAAHGAAS